MVPTVLFVISFSFDGIIEDWVTVGPELSVCLVLNTVFELSSTARLASSILLKKLSFRSR